MLALAPARRTSPTSSSLIVGIFALQLLLAFTITAFGVMVAVRIKQMQSFMGVTQMIDDADVLHLRRAVPGRRPAAAGSRSSTGWTR